MGGADLEIREATTAHELGHNMSMGHADWLECNSANPYVGASHVVAETSTALSKITGCEINYYGDMADVMGFGLENADFDGGSLSSPSAIRAGVWPSSAWVAAGNGVTNQVINSVSSHSGVRAVVVQDADGTNYFVEFRNFTGDDSEAIDYDCYPVLGSTGGGACFGETNGEVGVRILRIEPSGYQGIPGYDSFLIGHKTGHATPDDVKYVSGQTYTTEVGTTIAVTAITGTSTATIQVTRPVIGAVFQDHVDIDTTIANHSGMAQVGDTITAFMGEDWAADSFTFQWKNNGVNIGGATGASYVLTGAELGGTITVTVTGKITGKPDVSVASLGYGPIGVGKMSISGGVSIGGSLVIGEILTANSTHTATDINGPIASTTSFQWYRNGTAIAGATGSLYFSQSADYQQKITVKAVVGASGYTSVVSSASASVTPKVKGTFGNGGSTPALTGPSGGLLLGLTSALSDTYPVATSMSYQWYRGGVAVSGRTGTTYQLGSADFEKVISVKVTYKKSAYDNYVRTAVYAPGTANFSVGTVTAATLTGGPAVDGPANNELTANLGTYESRVDHTNLVTVLGTNPTIEWLRNGVVIPSATGGDTYDPVAADKGKVITLRLTMTSPGLLQNVQTFSTQALGTSLLVNSTAPVNVNIYGTSTATKTVLQATDAAVLGPLPVTTKWQWLRDGVSITNATKQLYTLTTSDTGHLISVRVTTSKSATPSATYTTAVRYSAGHNYSILPDATSGPYLSSGAWQVGGQLGLYGFNFDDANHVDLTPDKIAIQWYVNGVASGPSWTYPAGDQFAIPSAAYGKKVTAKLTVTKADYIPLVYYPASPYTIAKGVTTVVPTVDVESGGVGALHATISTPAPSYPTPSYTYRWYRNGVSISGATSATYKLTSSDYTKSITVHVTMKRTNFTVSSTALAIPAALDYSIRGEGVATIAGTAAVGLTLTATPPQFFEADTSTPLVPVPTFMYKWYSGSTLLATTSVPDLVLTSSFKGKTIHVKVTVTANGRLARTTPGYSNSLGPVVTGTIVPGSYAPVITVTGTTAKVTFTGTPTIPASGGFTATYKWYRNGVAISSQTKSSYKLVSSDTGKAVTVKVTLTKSGFNNYTGYAALAAN
ncbi:hypothetical protein BH09ACT4_BH09ACT4_11120 [soil metagenome]